MSETYLRHFELVTKNGDAPGAFAVLERVRGRTLAWALKDRKALPATESVQTVALEGDVAGLQARLMQTNSASEREQLLENLVEYERRLGLAWTREDVPTGRLPVQPAVLSNVENDLHPDEVLLEYVLDDPTSYCISVTHRGARVQALPTGREEVEKLSEQFVDDVRAQGAGVSMWSDRYRRDGRRRSMSATILAALLPKSCLLARPEYRYRSPIY